jgi:hypothetical protein
MWPHTELIEAIRSHFPGHKNGAAWMRDISHLPSEPGNQVRSDRHDSAVSGAGRANPAARTRPERLTPSPNPSNVGAGFSGVSEGENIMNHPANIACNAHKSAAELIEMSEREDRIIHAPYTGGLATDLIQESDGTAEGKDVVEFWGDAAEEHPAWRVHLHRES